MSSKGSSPRVRGTVASPSSIRATPGIIPACAGNSSCSNSLVDEHRDHPRVCGEQLTNDELEENIEGSSPRVRGTD